MQGTQVQLPAPISVNSQAPVTPALEGSTFSGLWGSWILAICIINNRMKHFKSLINSWTDNHKLGVNINYIKPHVNQSHSTQMPLYNGSTDSENSCVAMAIHPSDLQRGECQEASVWLWNLSLPQQWSHICCCLILASAQGGCKPWPFMGVEGIWDSSDGQSWPRNTHPDHCTVFEAAPPPNSLPFLTLMAQSSQPWCSPPSLPAPLLTVLAEDTLANALQGQSCLGLCLSEDVDSQSRSKMIAGFLTSRKTYLVFKCSETPSKLVQGHEGRSVASPRP